jgi:hypothetical protein
MLKITPGEWIVVDYGTPIKYVGGGTQPDLLIQSVIVGERRFICNIDSSATLEQRKANQLFIAEAGTVANQTGLMPSELLAQRDELVEKCKRLLNLLETGDYYNDVEMDAVKKLIAKVENK